MIYIGIDPGIGGGIAAVSDGGGVDAVKMPATAADLCDLLTEFDSSNGAFVTVENIGHSPPNARGFSGVAKLNRNFGMVLGVLAALKLPHETVPPQTWQAAYGLKRTDKNESDTAKKNRHKQAAQRRFPQVAMTHAIADALLLADYCRRTYVARYRAERSA